MSPKELAIEYKIQDSNVQYLARLIDRYGLDIFRTIKNRKFRNLEKEKLKGLYPANYGLQSLNFNKLFNFL